MKVFWWLAIIGAVAGAFGLVATGRQMALHSRRLRRRYRGGFCRPAILLGARRRRHQRRKRANQNRGQLRYKALPGLR